MWAGKNTGTCREHTAICSMLLASASNQLMGLTVLLALARSKAHVSLKCRGPYAKKEAQPYRIVSKLRQGDVLIAQGQSIATAERAIAVSEQCYSRWGNEYEGPYLDQQTLLLSPGDVVHSFSWDIHRSHHGYHVS